MKQYCFCSHFADRILCFINFKNSLGYPYEESTRILWNFDRFCCKEFPEKTELDREIGMMWLEKKDTENSSAHRNRVMVIREFSRFFVEYRGKILSDTDFFDPKITSLCAAYFYTG